MSDTTDQNSAADERIKLWMPLLFLLDVGLMFLGIFVANAVAWWIWLPFHLALGAYVLWVLYLAYRASRYVPTSIPFQRQLGIALYLSCHVIQFFGPAQIPLALVGYLLFAGPISLWFLFDHLLDD